MFSIVGSYKVRESRLRVCCSGIQPIRKSIVLYQGVKRLEIGLRRRLIGVHPRPKKIRHRHRREHADDGDHRHDLNKGEAILSRKGRGHGSQGVCPMAGGEPQFDLQWWTGTDAVLSSGELSG